MRLLLLVSFLSATGCLVSKPVCFDTAPDAVLTFQSSFAHDDVTGELGCFSQRFRQQNGGISLQGYATLRDRFLAPLGGLGRFVLRRNSLEDNLVGVEEGDGLRSRLIYSLLGHAFEIDATPEARFAFPDPSGARTEAPLARDAVRLEPRGATPPRLLVVEWNMPADTARALVASGLEWAEVANEWRLEGVTPLEELPKVAPPPEAPVGTPAGSPEETPESADVRKPARVIPVRSLAVREVRSSFGSVRLRVELELGAAAGCVRVLPDGSVLVANGDGAPRLLWQVTAVDPR